jgi:hypothetical protein
MEWVTSFSPFQTTDECFQGHSLTIAVRLTSMHMKGVIATFAGSSMVPDVNHSVPVTVNVETELLPDLDLQVPPSLTALRQVLASGAPSWLVIDGRYVMHDCNSDQRKLHAEFRRASLSGEICFAELKPPSRRKREVTAWIAPTDFAILVEDSSGRIALAYRDPEGRVWQTQE